MSRYFPSNEERGHHTIFPGVTIATAATERLLISVVDIAAHAVVEEHSHPHDQIGMVVRGRAIFTIGGEARTLTNGDIYVIPSGVRHKVVALEEAVQAVDVFTPVREEYR